MYKKCVSIFFLLILMIFNTFSYIPPIFGIENSAIMVPEDTPSIAIAIAMASNGGTVKINRGTYSENLYINKSIKLLGENKPKLLEPLTALNTRNVTIKGLNLEIHPPGSEPGITIFNVENFLLENLSMAGTGILLINSANVTIRNCTFLENPGPAIQIRGASRLITIENCLFNGTYVALSVQSGANITFRYNTVYAESMSIKLYGSCANAAIYLNNFLEGEAEDNGVNNQWYDPILKLGNLWGKTKLGDKNGDGILDEPKIIDGLAESMDKYPLAKEYREYLKGQNKPSNNFQILILLASTVIIAIIATIIIRKILGKRIKNV